MAKMADTPEIFDVIIMPNLYGDIASDVAAQIAGSVGLAGSSNIGEQCSMFEAIHGSAPRRAGQNLANPSGLFLGSILMLQHIGQNDVATLAHNAWMKTLEDGVFTYDIAKGGASVGTKEFAEAVVKRLGQKPNQLKAVDYTGAPSQKAIKYVRKETNIKRELNGVDVFIYSIKPTNEIGQALEKIAGPDFTLKMLSNRGAKVYPGGMEETFCTDHWRCRFLGNGKTPTHADIRDLLAKVESLGFEWIKLENLYMFDGVKAYSMGQGE